MEKGFTLIELLATLILIGVISMLATTSLNKQIKNTDEASYEEFINTLELATESYLTGRENDYIDLKTANNQVCINLKDLVLTSYLNSKTKNPKNDISIINSSVTVVLNINNEYEYTYNDNTLCN